MINLEAQWKCIYPHLGCITGRALVTCLTEMNHDTISVLLGKVYIALKFCEAKSELLHEFAGQIFPSSSAFILCSILLWSNTHFTLQNYRAMKTLPRKIMET